MIPLPTPDPSNPCPIAQVGVIGGGQLAWMMADAARKLGVKLIIQTPEMDDPAVAIAAETIFAPVGDATATAKLAQRCPVITFENEFVDLDALTRLEQQGVCFRPRLAALRPLLDKYEQRCFLQRLGLPTPQFSLVEAIADLPAPPFVLKARRHGYDGQGTWIVKTAADLAPLRAKLADRPLVVEQYIPFERELAVIAARSLTGEIQIYPVVETQQINQVCRWVLAPAGVSSQVKAQATAIAQTLLTKLDVVGVFGIELFLTADQQLLVNEIAPRVHNSGHFSLDACATSQFEQHLRAVCGLPLGSPAMTAAAAVMVNLLGFEHSYSDYAEQRSRLAAIPHAQVHWYGKTESRPGRKLGHVTVLLDAGDRTPAMAWARELESLWYE